jgi:hypothetical protein
MNITDLLAVIAASRVGKFHKPTPPTSAKKRGIGVTRKSKELSKSRRKMAKESRRKNRVG